MATIVILTLLLIGFFQVFIQSASYTKSNEEKLKAINIVRDIAVKIEEQNPSIHLNGSSLTLEGDEVKTLVNEINEDYFTAYDITLYFNEPEATEIKDELVQVTVEVKHKTKTGPNASAKTFLYLNKRN